MNLCLKHHLYSQVTTKPYSRNWSVPSPNPPKVPIPGSVSSRVSASSSSSVVSRKAIPASEAVLTTYFRSMSPIPTTFTKSPSHCTLANFWEPWQNLLIDQRSLDKRIFSNSHCTHFDPSIHGFYAICFFNLH